MASPHVADVVARVIQKNTVAPQNGGDVETLRSYIRNSAQRIGVAPLDTVTGNTFDGVYEGVVKAP